jgi:hypothetical protein
MTKKMLMLLMLAAFLLVSVAFAGDLARKSAPKVNKLITGDEQFPPGQAYPLNPSAITTSPGIVVGTTYYDYQSNGSSGNRMAVCNDGSRYFAWMNALNYPTPRHVYFNYLDATGSWYSEGLGGQVNIDVGAGYNQVDVIYGNRGAIAYHSMLGTNPTYTMLAVDSDPPGLGIFDYYNVPDSLSGNRRTVWPYLTVDRQDNIHILMSENTTGTLPKRMVYTRSNDGGTTWVSPPRFVDSVKCIAGVLDASPVSDKVIMAYSKMTDTSSQTWNDVVYILSQNGTDWDFANGKVNVTNYGLDDDSLWAYADLDVIFDYNDNFHIIWNANWSPTANSYYYRTYLFHYFSGNQEIHQIRTPYPDSVWPSSGCDFGGWNRAVSKMTLAVSPSAVYAAWTQFDTSDCSAGGYANGDIFASFSIDNGTSWIEPRNLTNSQTPGCFPGDCDSDHWSSLADIVTNDSLNLFYVNDKDAGGIVQTEGSATENPMMYLKAWMPTGIEDETNRPVSFDLAQNYPNPFNAKTVISFELKEAAQVRIEIFDITGAKVTTLVNKEMKAGNHQVTWDAEKYASGTYFYKLNTGDNWLTKQMVLLK